MGTRWPPQGYSDPTEYTKNEWTILALGGVLTVGFGSLCLPVIDRGVTLYVNWWLAVVNPTSLLSSQTGVSLLEIEI